MFDPASFARGAAGFPTNGDVNTQLSADAGRAYADGQRPYAGGNQPIASTPLPANFSGPYYGGLAQPFPISGKALGLFFIVVLGYFFARSQAEELVAGGVLGAPLLALSSRLIRVTQRATLWSSLKAACLAMAAYMVVNALFRTFGGIDDLRSDAVGIFVYAIVIVLMLRSNFRGVTGFVKAYAVGAVTLLLVMMGMGV